MTETERDQDVNMQDKSRRTVGHIRPVAFDDSDSDSEVDEDARSSTVEPETPKITHATLPTTNANASPSVAADGSGSQLPVAGAFHEPGQELRTHSMQPTFSSGSPMKDIMAGYVYTGNLALDDYNAQLRLLEFQNRRRLSFARQEQNIATAAPSSMTASRPANAPGNITNNNPPMDVTSHRPPPPPALPGFNGHSAVLQMQPIHDEHSSTTMNYVTRSEMIAKQQNSTQAAFRRYNMLGPVNHICGIAPTQQVATPAGTSHQNTAGGPSTTSGIPLVRMAQNTAPSFSDRRIPATTQNATPPFPNPWPLAHSTADDNSCLQDYPTQLMLLEKQNAERRQEENGQPKQPQAASGSPTTTSSQNQNNVISATPTNSQQSMNVGTDQASSSRSTSASNVSAPELQPWETVFSQRCVECSHDGRFSPHAQNCPINVPNYQTQLMLLEQGNKKRLMASRAKQAEHNRLAQLPGAHIVTAENFAAETTAADIESVMGPNGRILSCQIVTEKPNIIAEIIFGTWEGAESAVENFNEYIVDNNLLNVYHGRRSWAPSGNIESESSASSSSTQNTQPPNSAGGGLQLIWDSQSVPDPTSRTQPRMQASLPSIRTSNTPSFHLPPPPPPFQPSAPRVGCYQNPSLEALQRRQTLDGSRIPYLETDYSARPYQFQTNITAQPRLPPMSVPAVSLFSGHSQVVPGPSTSATFTDPANFVHNHAMNKARHEQEVRIVEQRMQQENATASLPHKSPRPANVGVSPASSDETIRQQSESRQDNAPGSSLENPLVIVSNTTNTANQDLKVVRYLSGLVVSTSTTREGRTTTNLELGAELKGGNGIEITTTTVSTPNGVTTTTKTVLLPLKEKVENNEKGKEKQVDDDDEADDDDGHSFGFD